MYTIQKKEPLYKEICLFQLKSPSFYKCTLIKIAYLSFHEYLHVLKLTILIFMYNQ